MKEQKITITEEMAFHEGVDIEAKIKEAKLAGYVVVNDHLHPPVGRVVEFELSTYIDCHKVIESVIMLSNKMISCGSPDLAIDLMRLNHDYLKLMEFYTSKEKGEEDILYTLKRRFAYHYRKVILQIPGMPKLHMPFDVEAATLINWEEKELQEGEG